MSSDLEAIILDQMGVIASLNAENIKLRSDLVPSGDQLPDGSNYYQSVYDRIFDAWEAFALAELGTARPSPVDLAGRPELMALWEAIR